MRNDWRLKMAKDKNRNEDVEITDFNREMSREERNYYGREFDKSR